jgi:hypothetical protein
LDGIPGSFEFVGRGELKPFDLDAKNAVSLLHEAVQEAMVVGLRWPEEPVILRPSQDLCRLVVESRKRSMAAALSA